MRVPSSLKEELRSDPVRVADVGARGGWQRVWADVREYLHLIGFEPERREWERLSSSAEANEVYSNRALYSDPGEVTLYHTREPATTSIYRPNRAFIERVIPDDRLLDVVSEEQVVATTLDHALSELSVESIDFLKLDTQGSELDILKGAPSALQGLFGIELEVEFEHIYVDQPLFPDVHGFLVSKGFRFIDFPRVYTLADFRFGRRGLRGYSSGWELLRAWMGKLSAPQGSWRGGSQVLYADAVYLRDPIAYLEASPGMGRRRVQTGVFVCSVLGYYEFAYDLLETGSRMGLVSESERRDCARVITAASRSVRHMLNDALRGVQRVTRRLKHPGR